MSQDFTAEILAAAETYARLGWHMLPLADRGKKPVINAWQVNASSDMAVIEGWWRERPTANLGVQLGQRSGIIDIECDSREAELALQRLFNDNPPATCCYRSTRGTHRLFKWREGMVPQAMFKFEGIEFRLGGGDLGALSVFPPSMHSTGNKYTWLVAPEECEPAELPDSVFNVARDPKATGPRLEGQPGRVGKPASHFTGLLKGVAEGGRNQSAAELIGRVLADMADPYDNSACLRQWQFISMWNSMNQPPLDDRELKRTFESILSRERVKRQTSEFESVFAKYVDRETAESPAPFDTAANGAGPSNPSDGPQLAEATPPAWRLVIVDSKPRKYKLYSPLWATKADGGYITLGSEQMLSPDSIRQQALEQADVWVSKDFGKAWNDAKDEKGLAAQLIDTAEHEGAPQEQKRDLVIAHHLLEALRRPRVLDEGRELDSSNGAPTQLSDGSIVFKFNRVGEDMAKSEDKVKRPELSELLKKLSVTDMEVGARNARVRLKCLSEGGLSTLKLMLNMAE